MEAACVRAAGEKCSLYMLAKKNTGGGGLSWLELQGKRPAYSLLFLLANYVLAFKELVFLFFFWAGGVKTGEICKNQPRCKEAQLH